MTLTFWPKTIGIFLLLSFICVWTIKSVDSKLFEFELSHLRRCKTAITWLWSLSAILPLFWRHDIAELHRLCHEDSRIVLWRHEICDVFPRIMTCALQNTQFSQYFTTKFNIFSLNLTGESDFFILFIRTHNKLSMSGFFYKIWMIRFFCCCELYGSKIFIL